LPEALRPVVFPGPEGPLEGLWKDASGRPAGAAVFAHPHPLHGGTLHNKVVYRSARALSRAGYGTLRFNFRGVGLSAGRHDGGRGEVDDFRAALAEAQALGGTPLIAGGFSFGAAVALSALRGDARIAAYVGVGLPLATSSGQGLTPPTIPALFLVGSDDTFGPPALLSRFVGDAARIIVIPGADHFFAGRLDDVERVIAEFLAGLSVDAAAS
jgi:alpha/beta superfamily hydrolase